MIFSVKLGRFLYKFITSFNVLFLDLKLEKPLYFDETDIEAYSGRLESNDRIIDMKMRQGRLGWVNEKS